MNRPGTGRIELALGPFTRNWPKARLLDLYAAVADEAPIDRVYLGEVVCGKRATLTDGIWPVVVERLRRAGKPVVVSLLARPTTARERWLTTRAARGEDLVEVNEIGALAVRGARPFVAGPFLDVHNGAALGLLAGRGCESWCAPPALAFEDVAAIARAVPEVAVERLVLGDVPAAVLEHCGHADRHGRARDGCLFACGEESEAAGTTDAAAWPTDDLDTLDPGRLAASGIRRLRLPAQSFDIAAVAELLRRLLDGALERPVAAERLRALMDVQPLAG